MFEFVSKTKGSAKQIEDLKRIETMLDDLKTMSRWKAITFVSNNRNINMRD